MVSFGENICLFFSIKWSGQTDLITKRPKNISHYIPGRFRSSQFQNITIPNNVWLTVSCWIFNSSISHKRQDARPQDGNAWRGRSMRAQTSRLQLATCKGPCCAGSGIPNEKDFDVINLLSWDILDILAVRYVCLSLVNPLSAHATHSMLPGPLGQFDDDDLVVNRTTRTTLYFFHKTNGTGGQSSDAALQPAQEMSVALFFFNGCYRTDSIPLHRMRCQK